MDMNRNDILYNHFFPYFYVNELIKLHQEIKEELKFLAVNQASIHIILEKYKVSYKIPSFV